MDSDAFPPSHLCWDAAGSAGTHGTRSKLLLPWVYKLKTPSFSENAMRHLFIEFQFLGPASLSGSK